MNKNGMTIIEILGAIMIIVILGLLSVPLVMNTSSKNRLDSSSESIKKIFELARQNSINNRDTHSVFVDIDSNQIHIEDSSGNMIDKIWSAPNFIDIADVSNSALSNTTSGTEQIDFFSSGSAEISGGASGKDIYIHIIQKGELISGSAYDGASAVYSPAFDNNLEERVKCFTVLINGGNGSTVTYQYGIGDPWVDTTI